MSSPNKPSTPFKSLAPTLGGYLAAFIALGGWSALNWQSQNDLNSKIAEFERYKTTEEGKLRERDLSLEKQKLSLESQQKDLQSANANLVVEQSKLSSQSSFVHDRESQIALAAEALSFGARAAKDESELNALANQVGQLGVNLRDSPPCNPDELRRYNQGKVLVSQISTRAKASGLSRKFEDFVQANSSSILVFGENCK